MSEFLDKLLAEGLTAFGKIQVQFRPPLVKAIHCRQALRIAKVGDIVLRKFSSSLDGYFIPGEFTHSGIVERAEDDRHEAIVIHAVAEGVSRIDLLDFVKDSDGFAILEPMGDQTKAYWPDDAVHYARMQVGKPYDFGFNVEADFRNVSAFFCHKMTALSIANGGVRIVPTLKRVGPVTHEVYVASQFTDDARIRTNFRTEF